MRLLKKKSIKRLLKKLNRIGLRYNTGPFLFREKSKRYYGKVNPCYKEIIMSTIIIAAILGITVGAFIATFTCDDCYNGDLVQWEDSLY